jgi:signal transduction histidine kinase
MAAVAGVGSRGNSGVRGASILAAGDLSKIEAGKLELNPESVNLAPLIDEVIGTAGQLAQQNTTLMLFVVGSLRRTGY